MCQPWFLVPANLAGVLLDVCSMLNVFPSLQLADLSAILSLATFASCGVSGGDGEYSHLQQDFVSRGMLTWVMSVKLLCEGTRIEPQDVSGSVEDATISLWLTSVDDWTY